MTVIYRYPPLLQGRLVKRYKRFFADIKLDTGETITAHCPNTGSMLGLSAINSLVAVSKSDNPKRKLAYTWEMVRADNTWVGVNTNLPNRIIQLVLEQKLLPQLANKYDTIRREVPYGKDKKSRIDFLLTKVNCPDIYLEVKNVTLAQERIALFPDTVTTRGQKHLKELMALIPETKAIMLYFINRDDCDRFSPGANYDPQYAKLFKEAVEKGVEVLPLRFKITPQEITYLGLAELLIDNL